MNKLLHLLGRKLGLIPAGSPAAHTLYAAAVAQARTPEFFEDPANDGMGVPNTVDGRFDMITLMVGLVVHRLSKVDPAHEEAAAQLSQDLFDTMFADMELNLREFGVSDEGMKHRIRDMAKAFMGRLNSYGPALDDEDRARALTTALTRNIYRREEEEAAQGSLALADAALARYQHLEGTSDADLLEGRSSFCDGV